MADELDRNRDNDEIRRTSEEDIVNTTDEDEEEFEDLDDDSDEDEEDEDGDEQGA